MKMTVAWFSVKDFEQAKRFYGQTLGLKKSFEMPGWAEFNGGGGQDEASIGLATQPHADNEPGGTIVLRVDNIESEVKRLQASGVKFEGEVNWRSPSLQARRRL